MDVTDLGVTGVFIILVLRTVFEFVAQRKFTTNGNGKSTQYMVKELYHWHAPDHEGKQSWKAPDLARQVARLTKNVDRLVGVVEKLSETVEQCPKKGE